MIKKQELKEQDSLDKQEKHAKLQRQKKLAYMKRKKTLMGD